jgi:hypothetical protein
MVIIEITVFVHNIHKALEVWKSSCLTLRLLLAKVAVTENRFPESIVSQTKNSVLIPNERDLKAEN